MEQINEQNPVTNQDNVVTPPEFNNYEAARPMLSFKEAVVTCWAKYANFSGRARRSEYWWFNLHVFLIMLLPLIIMLTGVLMRRANPHSDLSNWFIAVIFSAIALVIISLVFLVPSLAVTTRRLHDTGRSGWWIVASYVMSFISSFTQSFALPSIIDAHSFFESIDGVVIGWIVLYSINLILGLMIFVFTLLDSHKGENKYGPSPKYQ